AWERESRYGWKRGRRWGDGKRTCINSARRLAASSCERWCRARRSSRLNNVSGMIISELIQPKVRAAIVELRLPVLVAPVRFAERRVSHVGGRSLVRLPHRFWPLGSHRRPIVVREVIVG